MSKTVEEQIRTIIQKVEDYRGKDESKWADSLTGMEATQAILSIIDTEVIGHDMEEWRRSDDEYWKDDSIEAQNELRQAQRNKLRSKS